MVIFLKIRVQRKHLMNITTLENGDRSLELSEHERDILVQVATYLRDYYSKLDFSIRNFTIDEVCSVISIIGNNNSNSYFVLTRDETKLIHRVFREATNFVNDLQYDSILGECEDMEIVSGELYDLLFENLEIGKLFSKASL